MTCFEIGKIIDLDISRWWGNEGETHTKRSSWQCEQRRRNPEWSLPISGCGTTSRRVVTRKTSDNQGHSDPSWSASTNRPHDWCKLLVPRLARRRPSAVFWLASAPSTPFSATFTKNQALGKSLLLPYTLVSLVLDFSQMVLALRKHLYTANIIIFYISY